MGPAAAGGAVGGAGPGLPRPGRRRPERAGGAGGRGRGPDGAPGRPGSCRCGSTPPRASRRSRCVVYFHGGGWVIGDLDTYDRAVPGPGRGRAGGAWCSVDYRLAPEHRSRPRSRTRYAATVWASRTRGRARRRPGTGSPSAATAPAATWPRRSRCGARDRGGPPLAFQLLVYPVTGRDRRAPPRTREHAEGYLLTARRRCAGSGTTTSADADARRPARLAAAGRRPRPGCRRRWSSPPSYDPLRDEGEAYAARAGRGRGGGHAPPATPGWSTASSAGGR